MICPFYMVHMKCAMACHLRLLMVDKLWTSEYLPLKQYLLLLQKDLKLFSRSLAHSFSPVLQIKIFKIWTENFIINLENSKMEGFLLEKYRMHLLFVKSSGSFFAVTFLGDDHLGTDDFKVSARVNHGSVWSDFWVLGKVALGIERNCNFDILKGTFHFH